MENLRYTKLTVCLINSNPMMSRQDWLDERHPARKFVQISTSGNEKGLCCSERPISRESNVQQRAAVVGAFGHGFVHIPL